MNKEIDVMSFRSTNKTDINDPPTINRLLGRLHKQDQAYTVL